MIDSKIQSADRQIKNVTYVGVAINIALAIVKSVVGLLTGSMALLADGIHSVSDTATDVVVLLGVQLGAKEPDPEHPYGHGRLETFAAVIVAIVLVAVGGVMIRQASLAIARALSVENPIEALPASVLWVALVSVVAKELLYRATRKIAVATGSSALYANAWHHRSDALSSVAVVVGFVAMKFGYAHGDHVATIVVGLMIILVAVKIIEGCLHEFAERAVDSDTMEQIKQIIGAEQRIRQWHKLRTRSAGREIFMDLHILVDPQLNITEAHEIAEALENTMHAQITRPVNITVHIEPDKPELRK
ncbi:MAG: cation transporter [Planctomycetes bacterium]|nr:cation transporter [Planctomycetota bacterium]